MINELCKLINLFIYLFQCKNREINVLTKDWAWFKYLDLFHLKKNLFVFLSLNLKLESKMTYFS